MLVSRQRDSEQNQWSSKYDTPLYHKPSASSPRMSHHYDAPLSTQPDWQGQQYSFLPTGHNSLYPTQSYENGGQHPPNENVGSPAEPRSATGANGSIMDVDSKQEPSALRQPHNGAGHTQPSPMAEQAENDGDVYARKAAGSVNEGSVGSAENRGVVSNPVSSASSDTPISQSRTDDQVCKQEDEEDLIDDDDMDGDGEGSTHEMTAAERTAARRKMKRFRLTHQQTRFLMSEFAKQPHPDAGHRERLSREIPGLSPRQVQVWFQNRRAKIKRLTADDRERMIKMRAVPDDFDNVQALHSPYGAVHGLGSPMGSPVGYGHGPGPYGDHLMRNPLVVDVRRAEGGDSMSSTGLSPAFNGIGFSSSASMSNPDLLSPLSHPESGERYDYNGQLTPLSASAPRSGLSPMHSHHARQPVRPLQPLQLRDTIHRSRSDNLQSPLRSSMSWKGDSIDYTSYHAGSGSPQQQPLSGRAASVYQPPEPTSMGGYESSNYASSGYPNFQSNSFLNSQQNRSRLRASSATLPLGLDLSAQRPYTGAAPIRSATSPDRHLAVTSAPYTTSFPTAPLTAPSDFNLPRTPGFPSRPADYSMSQLSAPIAPPNDFSQAFQASMTSSARTPMRDTFMHGSERHHGAADGFEGTPGGELKRRPSITVTVTQP